jgi:hypothetical protein
VNFLIFILIHSYSFFFLKKNKKKNSSKKMATMWTDDQVRMLIDKRKANNNHYHSLGGGNCKRAWWTSLAGKINQRFRTYYTGQQASEKFHGIVNDCRVNIHLILYI